MQSVERGKTIPSQKAVLAQLGERQTEDLKVLCSIHRNRISFFRYWFVQSCTYPNTLE